jgi:hypothetical protein
MIALVAASWMIAGHSLQQSCALSATQAWNPQLINIIPDCRLVSTSPDGQFTLHIDENGRVQVVRQIDEPLNGDLKPIEPPAMLSWSPTSKYFAINDGEGSGMTSVLRVFKIANGQVMEDPSIQSAAATGYRRIRRCDAEAVDPRRMGVRLVRRRRAASCIGTVDGPSALR